LLLISQRHVLQTDQHQPRVVIMLRWAVVFFVVAIVAAIFGFGGIAGDAAWIAKILFFVFLVLLVLSFVFGRRATSV